MHGDRVGGAWGQNGWCMGIVGGDGDKVGYAWG